MAHYQLGLIALHPREPGSGSARGRESDDLDMATVRWHYGEGVRLEAKLAPFLRGAPGGPKATLASVCGGMAAEPGAAAAPPPALDVFGGAALVAPTVRGAPGWRAPRESGELAVLRSSQTQRLRNVIHEIVPRVARGTMISVKTTVPAPLRSTRRPQDMPSTLRAISLEELMAPGTDHVAWGRRLEVAVVSPLSAMSAIMCVVEDAQRYPALLAVYGWTPALARGLRVGARVAIVNPYCRTPLNDTVMVRVDEPGTLDVLGWEPTCWRCLAVERAGARPAMVECGACSVARYCSAACREADARDHELSCAVLARGRPAGVGI